MLSCYALRKHRLLVNAECRYVPGQELLKERLRIHSNEVVAFRLEDATYTDFLTSLVLRIENERKAHVETLKLEE